MPDVQSERVQWADDLARMAGWPRVTNMLIGVTAWEQAEGGGFGNEATDNPLNSTLEVPGSFPIGGDLGGGVHVQGYPTYAAGLAATLDTLRNGNYPNLVAALAYGALPSVIAAEVGQSPWGTPTELIVSCLPTAARAVADFYQVPGAPRMFIQTNDGKVFEQVVEGGNTIWRGLDPNLLPTLPTAWIVPDPFGHWLNRFAVKPAD